MIPRDLLDSIVRGLARIKQPVDPRTCSCRFCLDVFLFNSDQGSHQIMEDWGNPLAHPDNCLWARAVFAVQDDARGAFSKEGA